MKNRSGFTLIEIMMVVAIMGILAASSIPNLMEAIDSSRARACKMNPRNLNGVGEKCRCSVVRPIPATVVGGAVEVP